MAEIKRNNININNEDLMSLLRRSYEALEQFQRTAPTQEQFVPINQLGAVIKDERKRQKVTKDMLSKLSGVSIGTINAIELGKTTPSLSNVQKVLQALGKKLWIK